jgi:hypothetical protein
VLLADSKCKLQLKSAEGWGIANPQEEKILALTAKIKKMAKLAERKSPSEVKKKKGNETSQERTRARQASLDG